MEYTTVEGFSKDEFVEKKSRFIGYLAHVETEEEAINIINKKREEYWDASHNVYAYILRNGQIKRYSDDGEPQGTSGIPVLNVLEKEGLTDVCAVVTRYFGGIMLGAGGLVRAYSHGVKIAVDKAFVKTMSSCTEISMDIDYGIYGKITYIMPKYYIKTLESSFEAVVRLKLLIKDKYFESFKKEITEITSGQVFPYEGKKYYDFIEEK